MRLTLTLFATWVTAIALGAAWSSYDASVEDFAYKDDPYIIG